MRSHLRGGAVFLITNAACDCAISHDFNQRVKLNHVFSELQ